MQKDVYKQYNSVNLIDFSRYTQIRVTQYGNSLKWYFAHSCAFIVVDVISLQAYLIYVGAIIVDDDGGGYNNEFAWLYIEMASLTQW